MILFWSRKLSVVWLSQPDVLIDDWLRKHNGVFEHTDIGRDCIRFTTSEDLLAFKLLYDV